MPWEGLQPFDTGHIRKLGIEYVEALEEEALQTENPNTGIHSDDNLEYKMQGYSRCMNN
jgi:hypothetical protein